MNPMSKQRNSEQRITHSIIVPAYKEVKNITPLTERLFKALKASKLDAVSELIIVDDNSRDGSEEVVKQLAKSGYNVTIIVRTKERGLSSAVIAGFNAAKGDYLLCMDADLQHPPESVPDLFGCLQNGSEFVIGTRYGKSGFAVDKDWPLYRQIISKGARLMARPLTPMSDPMTGFFAIQAEKYRKCSSKINPIGFKIALEMFVKAGIRKSAEVPIKFGVRTEGESKLSSKVIFNYLSHLIQLYPVKYPFFPILLLMLFSFVLFGVFYSYKFIL